MMLVLSPLLTLLVVAMLIVMLLVIANIGKDIDLFQAAAGNHRKGQRPWRK